MLRRDVEKQVQAHLDKLSESVRVLEFGAGVSGERGEWEKALLRRNGRVTSAAGRGSGDGENTRPPVIAILSHCRSLLTQTRALKLFFFENATKITRLHICLPDKNRNVLRHALPREADGPP